MIPDADEPVSFETHIKPLFRQGDRESMQLAFDLWSHDDVSKHADPILGGSRPAPCLATARGPRQRSTSSDAGPKAANGAERGVVSEHR